MTSDFQWMLLMPVICLSVYGLVALVLAPWNRGNSRWLGFVSLIGMLMTGAILLQLWTQVRLLGPQETAFGMVRVDAIGLFFSFLLLVVGFLSVTYSMNFLEREDADHGEFHALILFCLAGMFVMLHTTNLMMILIGLEIFSLALYVLTGLTRMRVRSVEATLKYFLLGAFSSGFFVYGLALLYGATRSLDLRDISVQAVANPSRMMWVGMGLVLISLAFKIAAVPFHQWVPDVYQGAPTNVTGFMAAATKTAALLVLLRLLVGAFATSSEIWEPIVTWLAILTMTVANLVALAQRDLKRMLAFSSIAHAGYLLIAVVCGDKGVGAILFYLTSYSLMTVGAFAALAASGRGDAETDRGYAMDDWAGMGWRRPMLGAAMAFFLFSLMGMPPTGGFIGKFVIFKAAVQSDRWLLAIVGMLNATVAVYYYLRVVVTMYMSDPETDEQPLPVSPATAMVMVISMICVLYLGLAPSGLLELIDSLGASLI